MMILDVLKCIICWVVSLFVPKPRISTTPEPRTDTSSDPIDTRRFEGLRLHIYNDSVGTATIGYGHNMQTPAGKEACIKIGIDPLALLHGSQSLTQAQANQLFEMDYDNAANQVRTIVPNFDSQPLTVQKILVDLCFNMGLGTLKTFHNTLQAFIDNDYSAAADGLQHSLWYRQVGTRGVTIVNTLRSLDN